jgi:cytochrome b pre-mRNA-processing protein 3
MFMKWFENRKKTRCAADTMYERALVQSRLPYFYKTLGIPDSMDGRFDCLSLHVCLLLSRFLSLPKGSGRALSQRVFDKMFKGADQALRESGVGDLGVPKHMQKMMKAFNGRLHAYHRAFSAGDEEALAQAIMRNVYRSDSPTPDNNAKQMAGYMMASYKHMAGMKDEGVMAGAIEFVPINKLETMQEVA